MIDDATRDMMPGIFIKLWTSGKLFNLSRLKASTALKEKVICELLCAGGCAFVAHAIEDLQFTTNKFAVATEVHRFIVSQKKSKVVH